MFLNICRKIIEFYLIIVELCDIVYSLLRWPYSECNFICHIILKLEVCSKIPLNSTSFCIIVCFRSSSFFRIPFYTISVVLKAFLINANNRCFCCQIGKTCDAVIDVSSITKCAFNFRNNLIESGLQFTCTCSCIVSISSSFTIQLSHVGDIIRYSNCVKLFVMLNN